MKTLNIHIRLPATHWAYLIGTVKMPLSLREKLRSLARESDQRDGVEITLTRDEADQVRERCADHLQVHGFKEDYTHTNEGRILEELIDKFFTG